MTPTPEQLRRAYADLYAPDLTLTRLLGDLDALYATPEPPARLRDGFARLLAQRGRAPRAAARGVEAGDERELPARRGAPAPSDAPDSPTRPRWLRQSAALLGALVLFALIGGLLALVFRGGDTRPQLAASPSNVLASPTAASTLLTSTPEPTAPPTTPRAGFTPVTQDAGQCIISSQPAYPRRLFVMQADGSGLHELDAGGVQPYGDGIAAVWSPDGQYIAFAGYDGQDDGIFVMRADGTQTRRVTDGDGDSSAPAWSPDGTRIAFTRQQPEPGGAHIYVLNVDGSGLRQLTDAGQSEREPAWSPDGRQIAFSSDRAGNDDIYVMNADGSNQRALSADPGRDRAPQWRTESEIVFYSSRDGGGMFSMRVDGSDVQKVSIFAADDGEPAWSPDGARIAFVNGDDIFVMRADGTQRRNLTVFPSSDYAPRWSPDGQSLLFESDREGRYSAPAGSQGFPSPIVLRVADAQQAGGAGTSCWRKDVPGQGSEGQGGDLVGVSIPAQPITLTSAEPRLANVTLDVSTLGAPTAMAVEVYDYAAASARNRIINGAFVAPCAAPGGTEDGCVVRRVNAPATALTQAPVDLPPGEYIVVVSAAFAGDDYSGYTRQGFHVVVTGGD